MEAKSAVWSAKSRTVIEVQSAYGKGTEADPSRIVTEYWSMEGELLARNDPFAAIAREEPNAAERAKKANGRVGMARNVTVVYDADGVKDVQIDFGSGEAQRKRQTDP